MLSVGIGVRVTDSAPGTTGVGVILGSGVSLAGGLAVNVGNGVFVGLVGVMVGVADGVTGVADGSCRSSGKVGFGQGLIDDSGLLSRRIVRPITPTLAIRKTVVMTSHKAVLLRGVRRLSGGGGTGGRR